MGSAISVRLTLLMSILLAVAPVPASGQGIEEATREVARQIKDILTDNKLESGVTVGRFDSQFGPSATLGIQERLRRELERISVSTSHQDIEVTGRVRRNEVLMAISGYVTVRATSRRISIGARGMVGSIPQNENVGQQQQLSQQQTRALRQQGQLTQQENVAAVIKETEDLVALSAPTYEADLGGTPKPERARALNDEVIYGIEEPQVHIQGSTVSAFEGSDFSIELLTRDAGGQFTQRPRVTTLDDGNAFVDLKQGDQVAIRVINNSEYDVGTKILIDGLNSFSFSKEPAYRDLGLYFIERLNGRSPARSAYPVTGWHIDNNRVYGFNVTTLPHSAARELQQEFSGKVGVITVQFFPSWEKGQNPPAAELAGSATSRGRGLAFGKGDVDSQKCVEVKRHFGRTVVAAISVRYQHP